MIGKWKKVDLEGKMDSESETIYSVFSGRGTLQIRKNIKNLSKSTSLIDYRFVQWYTTLNMDLLFIFIL